MSNVLDLSGADSSGFDPIPAGEYDAIVYNAEMTETKGGPNAKLPAGSPMVKVEFRITEDEHKNRVAYTNYVLVGSDADRTAKALGGFVRFLVALGEDETKLKSKGFAYDKLSELNGKECVLRLGPPDPGYDFNSVKGVKAAGTKLAGSGTSGGLL